MINIKWFVITITFLGTLALAFTVGRCTAVKAPAERQSNADPYDPLQSVPTTVDTIYAPQPAETLLVEVPAYVDTNAIIEEYFSRHVYHDTLRASAPGNLGGSAVAIISDTVYQNVIAGRKVSLTFTPNRLATAHSVDLLSTWGLHNTSLMAGYRYRRWTMYAGYNFSVRAPVAGVGYQLIVW